MKRMMRVPAIVAIASLAVSGSGLLAATAPTWQERYSSARATLGAATTKETRFYALGDAAKAAIEVGKFQEGESLAKELLELANRFKDNWNYGNAIHDGHVVIGRVAAHRGDLEGAGEQLLAA